MTARRDQRPLSITWSLEDLTDATPTLPAMSQPILIKSYARSPPRD